MADRIQKYIRSRPARTAFIYMIVAATWIFTSSYLLPITTNNPELQGLLEIAKGLLFVVVTGALLYITLRNWTPEIAQKNAPLVFEFKLWNRIRIIPATFTLVILLPLLALLIYLLNAPALEREGLARLQGLASVQAIHIESWLSERKGDAEVLYHNRTLSGVVEKLKRTNSDESRSIVTEYLHEIQKNDNYEAIIVADRDGKDLLTIGKQTNTTPHIKSLIENSRQDGKVKKSNQFLLEDGHLHTDYIIPLSASLNDRNTPDAFIIMRSSLSDFLTRTHQPPQNIIESDEILLLHFDAENLVAFDTQTGVQHHTRERRKLQEHFPVAIAMRNGKSGTTITMDYRGKKVLTAWKYIGNTDWFILAKADRSTILAPLWTALKWGLLVGLFLIAAIIALLHTLWNRQQYYQQLEQLAREKQTDKLLKHFFDMPFVGMAIWFARNGKWVRFNDYLCEMLGYSHESMLKLSWDSLSHPDDLNREKEKRQLILEQSAQTYTLEKRMLRIDGSVIHTNVDVHCVRNEKGDPEIYVAIVQDVTAYKRTIEALRESEERFQNIFNGVNDGIVLAEKETGAFITGNTAFCSMLGYSNEEVSKLSIKDIHPEDEFSRIQQEFKRFAENKINVTEDIPVVRKDGSIFSADIRGGTISVGDKEYVIGIFRDTSERKSMMRALSDNERRLRTIINTIPDLVWLKDSDGKYLLCNTRFEQLYGASEDNIKGRDDYDFVDKDTADFFRKNDRIAIQARGPTTNEETVTFASDGHAATLETIKSPVTDSNGNLIGILGIGRDITLRKDYENKLRRLSQFYAALSQCNEAIIRSSNEAELLNEICRIAVQLTQINATWVGFLDEDGDKLHWVAGYGDGSEEIATATATVCTSSGGAQTSPSYQAVQQNQAVWIQDFPGDSLCKPCTEIATAHAWRSAASLPLYRAGAIVGVLNLYADVEHAFDEEVRNLLNEMAFDISFALDNFVLEKQRIASEESLSESEQRFRGLVEQSLSGIYIIQDDKYVYANPRLAEIFGFDSDKEMVGHNPNDFVLPDDREEVSEQIANLLQGKDKHLAYEAKIQRRDGTIIDIGVHGAMATHQGKPAIIGLVQDVTDKKRAEEQLTTYVEKLQASLMQTVEVATILSEMRDPYTAGHERRVAEIAVAIGKEMALDEYELEGLRVAGYLHDIGKINIPSEILSKPGKLTELEYEIIKGHPQSGYNALKDVDFPWPVAQVALQHHERINGSGYPQGLKGDKIILQARITAVADVVEAMGSHRPYRPGLGIKPALDEIERGRGTLYDPSVADACLRLFKEKGYTLPA